MSFEVQDPDNPTSTANAYISVDEFKVYHDDRGNTYTGTDTEIEQAIVRATDFMDARWRYRGTRYNLDQSTECPRAGVVTEGYAPDRIELYISGLPDELKEACAEYALIAMTQALTITPTVDPSGAKVTYLRTKVDVVERETRFTGSPHFSYPVYPIADAKMLASGLLAQRRRSFDRG